MPAMRLMVRNVNFVSLRCQSGGWRPVTLCDLPAWPEPSELDNRKAKRPLRTKPHNEPPSPFHHREFRAARRRRPYAANGSQGGLGWGECGDRAEAPILSAADECALVA